MGYQTVFKRYELKYIMTRKQKARILEAMEPYMTADKFGRSTIRNIYFDSDDFILARHSIAKPDFKEKLRIRSYSQATSESTVFVELKRKADRLVYKRRIALPEKAAMSWTQGFSAKRVSGPAGSLAGSSNAGSMAGSTNAGMVNGASASAGDAPVPTQMSREIDYFLSYYGSLKPAAFLSYERQAYKMRDCSPERNSAGGHDQDFRVTFDENILFRDYDLSLTSEVYGEPVLDRDLVLMELKCSGGIPLWMVRVLSEEHIYKTSFSKYGTAYTLYIQPELFGAAEARSAEEAAREAASAYTAPKRIPASPYGNYSGKHSYLRGRSDYPGSRKHGRAAASWLHFLGA